jgi:FixJ family two-component response regulator
MTTDADAPMVYIVDDDPGVLRAFARMLQVDGWAVATFDSAAAFLAYERRAPAACLVLDVSMPQIDGPALQARLAELDRDLPIVFVTGRGDIPTSVRAMKSGAVDFLTKPVDTKALVAAVREALAKNSRVRRAKADTANLQARHARLTPREREVLAALVAGRLNKQIAADLGIVEQTVKFHRARIMERMEARTVAELMHIAAQLGIGAAGSAAEDERAVSAPSAPRPRRQS